MKLIVDPKLLPKAIGAPALARGILVLQALGQESRGRRLEDLYKETRIPKASLLRLLDTLVAIGMVERMEDLRYRALWGLHPIMKGQGSFRQERERALKSLSAAMGLSSEWYEWESGGLRLREQVHPEGELRVQVPSGYIRKWGGELDAVAMLGYAFGRNVPPLPETLTLCQQDGITSTITRQEAEIHIQKAKESGYAEDMAFNRNGVLRQAAVVVQQGEPIGIVSVARPYRFGDPPVLETARGLLLRWVERLSKF